MEPGEAAGISSFISLRLGSLLTLYDYEDSSEGKTSFCRWYLWMISPVSVEYVSLSAS